MIIHLKNPHIILITETWFNINSITKLPNYSLYARNRDETRGGGVAIYVRSDLRSYEAIDSKITNKDIEHVWCTVKTDNETILVGCIYRPPYSLRETNLKINKIIGGAKILRDRKKYTGLLIVGDFNHPDISWINEGGICYKKARPSSLEFLDTINDSSLVQCVLEPTFSNNTLDLVLTDDPSRIFAVDIGPPLGASNKNKLHSTLTWDFYINNVVSETSNSKTKYAICKGNFSDFSNILLNESSNPHMFSTDVDKCYESLVNAYSQAMKLCVPIVKPINKNRKINPKWFNKDIKRATSLRFKLHCLMRSSPL